MSTDTTDFDAKLTKAIVRWAERHPCPDEPVLSLAGGRSFTPSELAREVVERTAFGKKQLAVLRHFAQTENDIGAEGLIRMFEAAATQQ